MHKTPTPSQASSSESSAAGTRQPRSPQPVNTTLRRFQSSANAKSAATLGATGLALLSLAGGLVASDVSPLAGSAYWSAAALSSLAGLLTAERVLRGQRRLELRLQSVPQSPKAARPKASQRKAGQPPIAGRLRQPRAVPATSFRGVVPQTTTTVRSWQITDADARSSVRLHPQGSRAEFDVRHCLEFALELVATVPTNTSEQHAVRLTAVALDEYGDPTHDGALPMKGPGTATHQLIPSAPSSTQRIELRLPPGARTLRLELHPLADRVVLRNRVDVFTATANEQWLATRPMTTVRVAMILDEFSYNSFRFECTPVVLTPSNWRNQMETQRPDVFFCESAWSGADPVERPWKGRVYASSNFDSENRGDLLEILDYCKRNSIPTVFWNKEDPSHYADPRHNFVDTALKFDHIFTTDEDCILRYQTDHGAKSVNVLPFAVQPRLFNPLVERERSTDVIFAGGWYANHTKRSEDMEHMFDALVGTKRNLKIYDRFYGDTDPLHMFPARFKGLTHPPVDHADMAAVYKESEIGMTINTVQESRTMFARRIFELMASNTFVVSNWSKGVEELFGKDVVFLDREPNRLSEFTSADFEQARERCLTKVLTNHTYRKRMETVLATAGVPFSTENAGYARIVRITDLGDRDAILRHLGMNYARTRIALIDRRVPALKAARLFRELNGYMGIVCASEQLLVEGKISVQELLGGHEWALLSQLDQEIVDEECAQHMLLHSQYAQHPIMHTRENSLRYRLSPGMADAATLVPSAGLVEFCLDPAAGLIYYV